MRNLNSPKTRRSTMYGVDTLHGMRSANLRSVGRFHFHSVLFVADFPFWQTYGGSRSPFGSFAS